MLKERVAELVQNGLAENESLFLIDFTIQANNHIVVIIDGDNGVTVTDCIGVSRAIEHNLDREEEDFSIDVMSAGATAPIRHIRQYKKNVGRKMEVVVQDEKIEGVLHSVTDNAIVLHWKAREPKPIGKGKVTVNKEAEIAISAIVEAKVMITFN